jgi:putative ABC transport system substrate-binding protein
MTNMQRRSFLTLLVASAAAWPLAARAQQAPMPVIGYLSAGSPETSASRLAAFRKGLSETGFIEGRNVTVEYRWAHNEYDRLPELASDLIRRKVTVIITPQGAGALAAKAATVTIPIVFGTSGDPVQGNLVASLNRPGGNMTGFASMGIEVTAKRVGLLHELLPAAARFALFVNPIQYTESVIAEAQSAASAIGRQIEVLQTSTARDIDAAFARIVQTRSEALLINPSALFSSRRVQIVTLATRHALPAIYPYREDALAGGLMSYGSSLADYDRQLGIYAGRIIKGEKPSDLPVMQPSKFEFVINLQTARTLGIEVPPTLLAIADEVIE